MEIVTAEADPKSITDESANCPLFASHRQLDQQITLEHFIRFQSIFF